MIKLYLSLFVLASLFIVGCDSNALTDVKAPDAANEAPGKDVTQTTELFVFQSAGDVGGGVLEPGTEFPPTNGSLATLKRKADKIEYTVETTGLPPGAYTNWIVTINEPENCLTSPCTDFDVFVRTEEVDATVFWAAGNTVSNNGKGRFSATIKVGELPTGDDQVGWPGSGLQNPLGGEFHIIVKYHGSTSTDPEVKYEQLSTLTGSCEEGANALDLSAVGFGIQCFDPQAAIFQPL